MQRIGCFGIPSIFSFESRVCGKCKEFVECQKESEITLRRLPEGKAIHRLLVLHENFRRKQGGLDPLPIVAQRAQLSPDQESVIRDLPKKTGAYLRKLMIRGKDVEIREAAHRGENPFEVEGHRPYHLAFDALLSGGFTKPYLRAAFIEGLGWSESASFSQVSIIWKLFPALGVAEESGCALVASPNVRCNNNRVKY